MKKLTIAILLLIFPMISNAQNIYTIAGNSSPGYSGNGLPATSGHCEFNGPSGLVIDKAGNIYIADDDNNVIRVINTSGIISVFAGTYMSIFGGYSGDGGPATDAEINEPGGICTDSSGNIFIADYANNAIREVNTSGIISTVAGTGFHGYSGDGGPATAAELYNPEGVFVDKYGNILIADLRNCRIREINTAGIISTIAGNGQYGYTGDGVPATATEINSCYSMCVDTVGNIIIMDGHNDRIRKINTSGIISTIAGIGYQGYSGDGGPATAAELYEPLSICFDASGDIIFSDDGNTRIRKINKSGIISTIAGIEQYGYSGDGGPATSAEIDGAWGIYPDLHGDLCFADQGNNVIREIVSHSTGIENISDIKDMLIYPNPANQKLNLQFNKQLDGLATLSIMDIAGREIFNFQLSSAAVDNSQLSVDVSSLSAGMYFLNVKTKDNYFTQKFIKD
jgi:trimeric autotransporter adhesin